MAIIGIGALEEPFEQHMDRVSRGPETINIFTLPKDVLGLWEQTVCEIRAEIKSWDLIGPHTKQYATSLCDKLEHSMCAVAGGNYPVNYQIDKEVTK